MDKYVVCAADGNVADLLVSFVGSLKDVAKWKSEILILDYGIEEPLAKNLKDQGVSLVQPERQYSLTIDRFASMAGINVENATFAMWDADVWFCGPIDELFENDPQDTLWVTIDCIFQPAVQIAAVQPMARKFCEKYIKKVVQRYYNILQVGFVYGKKQGFKQLAEYITRKFNGGFLVDCFWADTTAFNWYAAEYPEKIQVVEPTLNCLPIFKPIRVAENKTFWLNKGYPLLQTNGEPSFQTVSQQLVSALHMAGPTRKSPLYSEYAFAYNYPELQRKWEGILL